MDEFPNTNGYSFSWTQPYNSLNAWFGSPQAQSAAQDRRVEEEMIRIEAVDNIIQNMLTYPDAEVILKKITKEQRHD